MPSYSVTEAKRCLSQLIDRALAGEDILITRRGKPAVELRATGTQPSPPIGSDAWLEARTKARPGVGLTSVEILDLLYEQDEE